MKVNLSIKMISGFLAMSALLVLIGYLAISSIEFLQQSSRSILKENVSSLKAAEELEIALLDQKGYVSSYLLDGNRNWLNLLEEKKVKFNEWFRKAREVALTEKEKQILLEINKFYKKYDDARNRVIILYQKGDISEARRLLLNDVKDELEQIYDSCEKLLLFNEQLIAESAQKSETKTAKLYKIIWTMVVGSIFLGVIFGILISRGITKPIRQLVLKAKTATGEDIIEKIDIEKGDIEELESHVVRLIEQIEQSHKELEENREKLFQSQKLASLGQLSSGVAHEIRNPLTSIKMRAYSLQDELRGTPSQSEDIRVIGEEIERIEKIVQEFLDFVKPPEPNYELADINKILDSTLSLLIPNLKKQHITVEKSFNSSLPKVSVDKERIRQVFLNLALNSIQSMPDGGKLTVRSELNEANGKRYIEVKIIDTGAGISEESKDKIFDPFFSTKSAGSGLGLSIAYRVLELHRAEISFESRQGRGTVFTVKLPLEKEARA
jgi:signal transduction histidine kinase